MESQESCYGGKAESCPLCCHRCPAPRAGTEGDRAALSAWSWVTLAVALTRPSLCSSFFPAPAVDLAVGCNLTLYDLTVFFPFTCKYQHYRGCIEKVEFSLSK